MHIVHKISSVNGEEAKLQELIVSMTPEEWAMLKQVSLPRLYQPDSAPDYIDSKKFFMRMAYVIQKSQSIARALEHLWEDFPEIAHGPEVFGGAKVNESEIHPT